MDSSIQVRLVARLRQLRTARGLTQEAFAELAGISYKYYQQIEIGRKLDLRLSTLERLARAHDMEVAQLFADLPTQKSERKRGGRRASNTTKQRNQPRTSS